MPTTERAARLYGFIATAPMVVMSLLLLPPGPLSAVEKFSASAFDRLMMFVVLPLVAVGVIAAVAGWIWTLVIVSGAPWLPSSERTAWVLLLLFAAGIAPVAFYWAKFRAAWSSASPTSGAQERA